VCEKSTIKYEVQIICVFNYPCVPSPSVSPSPDNREYTLFAYIPYLGGMVELREVLKNRQNGRKEFSKFWAKNG
jgi:hypothetical protein